LHSGGGTIDFHIYVSRPIMARDIAMKFIYWNKQNTGKCNTILISCSFAHRYYLIIILSSTCLNTIVHLYYIL
jgi:hypothetical protein